MGKPAETDRRHLKSLSHSFTLDCNIYAASERAGKRVMQSVTGFITRRLKRKVNETKSAVARPQARKFLGFSFSGGKEPKRRIAPQALLRCQRKVRELTRRTRGISLEQMTKELATYLRGWKSYFGFSQTPSVLRRLEQWIRRRLLSPDFCPLSSGSTIYSVTKGKKQIQTGGFAVGAGGVYSFQLAPIKSDDGQTL